MLKALLERFSLARASCNYFFLSPYCTVLYLETSVLLEVLPNSLNPKDPISVKTLSREVRKNGRSKICPFLYSNGHTEAKKIPENFFPWYHLACFFKMKIFKKILLAKTHQEGLKIGYSQKNFFWKMTRKSLRKILHRKKAVNFF